MKPFLITIAIIITFLLGGFLREPIDKNCPDISYKQIADECDVVQGQNNKALLDELEKCLND